MPLTEPNDKSSMGQTLVDGTIVLGFSYFHRLAHKPSLIKTMTDQDGSWLDQHLFDVESSFRSWLSVMFLSS